MSIFPSRILLATDGSEEAELAALRAVDIAETTDSELHAVHVGVLPTFLESYPGTLGYSEKLYEQIQEESRERLRELSWRVQVAGGTVAGSHLRMGKVDLEVVALAKELDVGLIVMGCRGHHGIRRAIEGSISDGVIRHAPCPVLVVRSHENAEAFKRSALLRSCSCCRWRASSSISLLSVILRASLSQARSPSWSSTSAFAPSVLKRRLPWPLTNACPMVWEAIQEDP